MVATTTDDDAAVASLMALLACDSATAAHMLESCAGNVDEAASLYFTLFPNGNATHGGGGGGHDAAAAGLAVQGNVATMHASAAGAGATARTAIDVDNLPDESDDMEVEDLDAPTTSSRIDAILARMPAHIPSDVARVLASQIAEAPTEGERDAMLRALEVAASGGDSAAVNQAATATAAPPPTSHAPVTIIDDDVDVDDNNNNNININNINDDDDTPPEGVDAETWAALPEDVKADLRRQHNAAHAPSTAAALTNADLWQDGVDVEEARMLEAAMLGVPYEPPVHRRVVDPETAAAAAAAAQPESTRLRWEQDDAYEESLRADRAREAERRKQQEEEEEAQREAVEAERAAQLEEDRKAAEFAESDNDAPPEPATGPRVALRLLNGSRVVRRFSADDTLLEIRRWARRALRDAGCVPDGAWSVKGEGDMFPTSRDELKASTVAQHGVGGSVLNIVRL